MVLVKLSKTIFMWLGAFLLFSFLIIAYGNGKIGPNTIQLMVMFSKAGGNKVLQNQFNITIASLLDKTTDEDIRLHIVGDDESQLIAKDIIYRLPAVTKNKAKLTFHDMQPLAHKVTDALKDMLQYFRKSPTAYYGDNLFFISIVIHEIFPDWPRIAILDADLKFEADVRELWNFFDAFDENQLIGLGREMQPVYLKIFKTYRDAHPGTRIGQLGENGHPGFNSGVLLLDLEKIRNHPVYKDFISPTTIINLADKFKFQGHLGDQDFYTLLGAEYPGFFYRLPCQWNRQLCTWWKGKGFDSQVFDDFYRCEEPIKIYHGNCKTPIPGTFDTTSRSDL